MRSQDLITPELLPSEKSGWIGAPSPGTTIRRNAVALVFGMIFVTAPWFSNSADILTIALSSFIGSVSIFGAVVEIVFSGRTAYAITDQRIIVVRRFRGPRVESLLPDSINVVEKKVRPDGSGSVVFRVERVNGLDAGGVDKIGFHGIQNVEAAYDALMRLRPL